MAETEKKRILLVDEDDILRRSCSDALSGAGYRVESASNGVEAACKLKEASFDLVIMGMELPGEGSTGLYLDTLKIYSEMTEKFLFMERESCEQAPPFRAEERYLAKPFNMAELLRKVEALTGVSLPAFLMRYKNLGENRRAHRRLCWAEDLRVSEGPAALRPFAHTMDISRRGVRIRYMGRAIKPGSVVNVEIKCVNVNCGGLVVWSRTLSDEEASSGLSLAEPVPASALAMIARGRNDFVPPVVSGG